MKISRKWMTAALISVCVLLVFLLFAGVCEWISHSMTSGIQELDAGARWSSDGSPYATIALYTDISTAMTRNTVEGYAYSISNALLSASVDSPEGGSSWTYAYYGEETTSVTGPKGSASAELQYVGGSFFVFHPLHFLYGAPFTYDSALPDGVVIDETLAWRIFGALDVVGMELTWNNRSFTVCGIVQAERSTAAYQKAYGETGRIYMSYYGFEIARGSEQNITAFEVTIPNAVKSFAMNIFNSAVTVNEDTMIVHENSERYSFVNRFKSIATLPYQGMRNERIVYPYYENELRVLDFQTGIWMTAEVVGLVGVALGLLSAVFCVWRSGFSPTAIFKKGLHRLGDAYDKKKTERMRKKKHKKARSVPNPATGTGK